MPKTLQTIASCRAEDLGEGDIIRVAEKWRYVYGVIPGGETSPQGDLDETKVAGDCLDHRHVLVRIDDDPHVELVYASTQIVGVRNSASQKEHDVNSMPDRYIILRSVELVDVQIPTPNALESWA